MRRRPQLFALALLAAGCASGGGAGGSAWSRTTAASTPTQWRATGTDTFEVWICHVPTDSTNAAYGGLQLRRPLAVAKVTAFVGARVTPYFEHISHGVYDPVFVAGGDVTMAAADGPQQCVDAAVAKSSLAARAVLAVADAEQAPDQQGGFGDAGAPTSSPAPVRATRRYAYVGASDFNPAWGTDPPMDLVEHEVGHTLGWVHSGTDAGPPVRYLSALDVMSNSAAPRDADPNARDAPDTLAVNRVIAGWLTAADVVVRPAGGEVRLSPSAGSSGTRVLVLPADASSFLTVELLTPDGFDAHLPHAGLAIHRVHVQGGLLQSIDALNGAAPFTALLRPGESLDASGWRVTAGPGGRAIAVRTTS